MTRNKTTKAGARTRTEFEEDARQGAKFWLGPITRTHELGEYQLIEYKSQIERNTNDLGKTYFSGYINGRGTRHSSTTIEGAITNCIAHKQLGPNSQAGILFMVMVGLMAAKPEDRK